MGNWHDQIRAVFLKRAGLEVDLVGLPRYVADADFVDDKGVKTVRHLPSVTGTDDDTRSAIQHIGRFEQGMDACASVANAHNVRDSLLKLQVGILSLTIARANNDDLCSRFELRKLIIDGIDRIEE